MGMKDRCSDTCGLLLLQLRHTEADTARRMLPSRSHGGLRHAVGSLRRTEGGGCEIRTHGPITGRQFSKLLI